MNKAFYIRLDDLHFISKIGVEPQERIIGNEFIVNVKLKIPANSFIRESLESSVSYALIYDLVREKMSEVWLLLESVAQDIVDSIMNKWPQIEEGQISIKKLSPPIRGIRGSASVEYSRTK